MNSGTGITRQEHLDFGVPIISKVLRLLLSAPFPAMRCTVRRTVLITPNPMKVKINLHQNKEKPPRQIP